MGPKTKELIRLLAVTFDLLDSCGEEVWSLWLERARRRLEQGDLSGATYLLAGYGGMGSFNDLVLHPLNGHRLAVDQVDEANQGLEQLRGRMYGLALKITHEADLSSKN